MGVVSVALIAEANIILVRDILPCPLHPLALELCKSSGMLLGWRNIWVEWILGWYWLLGVTVRVISTRVERTRSIERISAKHVYRDSNILEAYVDLV